MPEEAPIGGERGHHVVVVGGGASAASLVVSLLRMRLGELSTGPNPTAVGAETDRILSDRPLRVTVLEKEDGRPPWAGIAWATRAQHHLMNVPCCASKRLGVAHADKHPGGTLIRCIPACSHGLGVFVYVCMCVCACLGVCVCVCA